MFAGEKALTADKEKLKAAEEMAAAGESNEDIRRATGWHKGRDGKMRYEIDDSGMEYRGFSEAEEKQTLGEYIRHDELFSAYPELRDIRVVFEDIGGGAIFEPENRLIILDKSKQNDSESAKPVCCTKYSTRFR